MTNAANISPIEKILQELDQLEFLNETCFRAWNTYISGLPKLAKKIEKKVNEEFDQRGFFSAVFGTYKKDICDKKISSWADKKFKIIIEGILNENLEDESEYVSLDNLDYNFELGFTPPATWRDGSEPSDLSEIQDYLLDVLMGTLFAREDSLPEDFDSIIFLTFLTIRELAELRSEE